jgi:protein-S-isoprenylcysteine O-methyltransferase Ste14
MTLNTAKFLAVMGIVLFVAAGTVRYWNAWLFVALQLVWLEITGGYFLRRDPALVERRLIQDERGEKEGPQKIIIGILRVIGLIMLVIAGLDRRFGWSSVPLPAVVVGCVLFVAGGAVIFAVFATNTYTSSIVEVDAKQTVVDTGLYGIVRHPFYAGTLLQGLGTPLVLGSYWVFVFIPPAWALLVLRILAEERFLSANLPGYDAYIRKTRHRLIPRVW